MIPALPDPRLNVGLKVQTSVSSHNVEAIQWHFNYIMCVTDIVPWGNVILFRLFCVIAQKDGDDFWPTLCEEQGRTEGEL